MDEYKSVLSSLKIEDVEKFIGMTEYVSKSIGIGGIIKACPEDFMVWEILESGEDAKRLFESSSFFESYGNHHLCVMKKVNLDTIRAVSLIAKRLNLRSKEIGICGIKDKVSISWQFLTIPSHGVESGRTLRINSFIEVKPVRSVQHKISSRQLRNNAFHVVIRYPRTVDTSIIDEVIRELEIKGVPNYYGHQRFGITRPITPIVGLLIMKNDLRKAVAAFLSEHTNLESERNRLLRKELAERWDLEWASEHFPRSLTYERIMIDSLMKYPGDYVRCLRALPLRLRRLLVESVAARIFNLTLSKIIKEGRFNELEVGDIVLPLNPSGRADKNKPVNVTSRNIRQIEKLVKNGKMVVALPSPGYLSPLPRSSKGEIMLRVMEEEGVDFKDFKVEGLPEASTKGSLRPMKIPKWTCSVTSVSNESLALFFMLPPGSYATVLLREIMKPENPLAYIGKLEKQPS